MRITLPLILSSVLLLSACESMSSGPEISLKNFQSMEGTELQVPPVPAGTKDGEYLRHYNDGTIRFKSRVKNGCYDRYIYAYYGGGRPQMTMSLKNCKVNGVVKNYLQNGNLKSEITVRDGRLYGPFKYYHDSASNGVYIQGTMENGAFTGTVKQFDTAGKLVSEGKVTNGRMQILK